VVGGVVADAWGLGLCHDVCYAVIVTRQPVPYCRS
jgi:hypothetical protein